MLATALVRVTAVVCTVLLASGDLPSQETRNTPQPAPAKPATPAVKPPDQLDSLVAPIALYPDPLLAQILAASTYPLEIVQAQRWVKANPSLKGEDLAEA